MEAHRPTTYTPELADKITALMAQGKSLNKICKNHKDLPTAGTIYRWLGKYPDFKEKYDRACEDRMLARIEEAYDIIEDTSQDFIQYEDADGNVRMQVNTATIARMKENVSMRKWEASKLLPKYADRTKVEGGDKPISVDVTSEEAARKIAFLLAKADKGS